MGPLTFVVDESGGVASKDIVQIVEGSWGTDGASRLLFQRRNDGAIIGVDGNGMPAFVRASSNNSKKSVSMLLPLPGTSGLSNSE